MKQVRVISLIALLAVLALALPTAAMSTQRLVLPLVLRQTESDLALLNAGFEGAFVEFEDTPELKVAEGWTPWWDEDARRPEYKRAALAVDPGRVHGGSSAQQWFTTYATHTAGVYQRVGSVPVGRTVVFEAWVQAFSSSEDDFDHSNGKYRMRIGIDPYGGLDPESADIIWSNDGHAVEPYDAYQQLQVQATARSDRVTVWVWGQAEWALKHNDAYCDDARLYLLSDLAPSPAGLTEEEVRAIVRDELAAALRAWADQLAGTAP